MQEQGTDPRIAPWGVLALYMGAAGLWLWVGGWWLMAQWPALAHAGLLPWLPVAALVLCSGLLAAWLWARLRRLAHARAQAQRELLLLVRHAPAGMARVQVGGTRIVWANDQLAHWLGLGQQEMCGMDFAAAVPQDEPAAAQAQLTRLLAGEIGFFQEQRHCVHRATGEITPVLCTSRLVTAGGAEGGPVLVCVLQDMGEMHAAREALARSENRLRMALEGSGSGVWEWDAPKRQYGFAASLAGMLRYEGADLVGDFHFAARLHPEDRRCTRRMLLRVLRDGEPLVLTVRLRCFDGNYRWFNARGQRHLNGQGQLQRISGLLTDQTASRDAEERSRLAATVVDNTIEGVVVTDARSRILSVNQAFTRLLGYTEAEMLGQTPRMFKSGRHDKPFYDAMWTCMRATGHWQGEIWNRRKNGEIFPERMSLSAVYDGAGLVTHYVCMFTDISQDKAQQAQLEFLAHRDTLTGLPNRARFAELLNAAVGQASERGEQMAVMLINIDRFKDVNDSYGHVIGDEVLKHIAQQLQSALRPGDVIGRMAGDEIAVLAKALDGELEASAIARRLIEAAGQPWRSPDGLSVVAGVSVGICMYPRHSGLTQELLQGAHAAVHGAKERGRGGWCFFHEDMTQSARERLALESRLRQALAQGHMRLFFQPQIDIASGRMVGAEALVRWLDPEEGLISPARFIPVAESSGVIGPLGLWVLREACAQGQRWRAAGLPEITIAVNVSLHQFLLTDIAGATMQALQATGFPASQLELEITESALAKSPDEALAVLRRLRNLGLRLAIDDFGTGYSSLAHLKRFPIDVLKIDQGFIRDIPHSADDMAISGSVIALGHAMGLKVLAEGVETEAQLEFLRQKGCDCYQGYWYSRPVPADAFAHLLAANVQESVPQQLALSASA